MANALKTAEGELTALREKVHNVFNEAVDDLDHSKVKTEEFSSGQALRDFLKASEDEMGELRIKVDDLRDVEKIRAKNAERLIVGNLPRNLRTVYFEPQPMDAAYRWRIETTVVLNQNGYTFFD